MNLINKDDITSHMRLDVGSQITKDLNPVVPFDPILSATTSENLSRWIQSPVTGDLNEVPGIGFDSNQSRLAAGDDDCITTTFQLLGKFMILRSKGTDSITNAQLFNQYLHSKGITSHRNSIVQAVAEKVNMMIPGSYDPLDYCDM